MIKCTFRLGGDIINVIIDAQNIMFADGAGVVTTIHGLRLNKSGVIKEHPDLKDDEDWKIKCIERFKKHVKSMKTEKNKADYVIEELGRYGYLALYTQRAGHRPVKVNAN